MASMHNYKNLEVWKKARALVKEVYQLTESFPSSESFGLTSQFRRAAVSISLNIAEGSGRGSDKDFCRFLDTAFGSALEVENLIFLSYDLKFISLEKHDEFLNKIAEIQRMLKGLQSKLNSKSGFLKSFVMPFTILVMPVIAGGLSLVSCILSPESKM